MENITEKMGYLINTASRLLTWEFNNRLKIYGLTSTQWAIIKDLHEQSINRAHISNFTPAAIANRLKYDRPTIWGVIDRLINQQMVLRCPNPFDKRSQIIELAPKANAILHEINDLSIESTTVALSGFSGKETAQFKDFLSRIINNLSMEGNKEL